MSLNPHSPDIQFKKKLKKNIYMWIIQENSKKMLNSNSSLKRWILLKKWHLIIAWIGFLLVLISSLFLYIPKEQAAYIWVSKLDRLDLVLGINYN